MQNGRYGSWPSASTPLLVTEPMPSDVGLAVHVLAGLSAGHKYLSSRYFYDDEGSRLFQRIVTLPEYYLARVEREILQQYGIDLAAQIASPSATIDLIELGSGDGDKSLGLCQLLDRTGVSCTYHPMDLSVLALRALSDRFAAEIPNVVCRPLCGDYFQDWPITPPGRRRAVLFMGSNLGNLTEEQSVALLRRIRERVCPGDVLVLGLDLQKDPQTILDAYNDRAGVTAAFNLNLLRRLNRELVMDFELDYFRHYATYNPLDGAARSFLVSLRPQTVRSRVLGCSFEFGAGEPIYTEQSQKYTMAMIDRLASACGFAVRTQFIDSQNWYAVTVWEATPWQPPMNGLSDGRNE